MAADAVVITDKADPSEMRTLRDLVNHLSVCVVSKKSKNVEVLHIAAEVTIVLRWNLSAAVNLELTKSFQLPAPQSGTLSRISSRTRPSVQTVLDVCLKCICLLDTSAFGALEVLDDNRAV